jgi:hypothetical protein
MKTPGCRHDKPARTATIFIHNGAPPAQVGCLDRLDVALGQLDMPDHREQELNPLAAAHAVE